MYPTHVIFGVSPPPLLWVYLSITAPSTTSGGAVANSENNTTIARQQIQEKNISYGCNNKTRAWGNACWGTSENGSSILKVVNALGKYKYG